MGDILALNKSSELLNRFVSDGNEVVEFKLVSSVEDLSKPGFHPEMCHQVFNEQETVFGYSALKITLFITSGSLKPCMTIKYDEKVSKDKTDGVEADDIFSKMNEVLRAGYTPNLDEFSKIIEQEKDFKPIGELIHKSQVKDRDIEIWTADGVNYPKFIEYLKRMEVFLLFYVDAGTFVECEDDDKWRGFVMYEKTKTPDGKSSYSFLGYSTVYQFYVYPEHLRPRIAQMLILPPFLKKGLGSLLLSTIYTYYRSNPKVIEITVEQPSDEFELMRDFVDAKDCKNKLKSYQNLNSFTEEMIKEARQVLKMTKLQARRCYEILKLEKTNINDEREFREYRIDVKRRLNVPYEKQEKDIRRMVLRGVRDLSKVNALDEQTRKTELESGFQLVFGHYQKVIERLEKF